MRFDCKVHPECGDLYYVRMTEGRKVTFGWCGENSNVVEFEGEQVVVREGRKYHFSVAKARLLFNEGNIEHRSRKEAFLV